ncbi:MAG TPA: hypothetical protein VGC79_03775, partial [Polyangiaceae bacterium]
AGAGPDAGGEHSSASGASGGFAASGHDGVGPNGGGNAGGGDRPPGSTCLTDLDCASLPHVRPAAPVQCSLGKCVIPLGSCAEGFGHCSASDLDVCETSLSTASNCGACGKTCGAASSLCMDGKCVSACSSAKPDACSGVCVDTASDPTNCGACGMKCGAPGDLVSCEKGKCSVTCTSKAEDCFNGNDDDCDGKIDCADSDCTAPAFCVPPGYGVSVAAQAACPAGFLGTANTLHAGLKPGPGCTGCGCTPAATNCFPLIVSIYNSPDCSNQPPAATYGIDSNMACGAIGVPNGVWTHFSTTPAPIRCATTGGTMSPAEWTTDSKFCTASVMGGGCSGGDVCVPRNTSSSACALQPGDQACPSLFPNKQLVYGGFTDGRTCSCACEGAGGGCDALRLKVWSSATDCSAANAGDAGLMGCKTGQSYGQFVYTLTGAPSGPTTCTASNVLTGTLTTKDTQTLCCY